MNAVGWGAVRTDVRSDRFRLPERVNTERVGPEVGPNRLDNGAGDDDGDGFSKEENTALTLHAYKRERRTHMCIYRDLRSGGMVDKGAGQGAGVVERFLRFSEYSRRILVSLRNRSKRVLVSVNSTTQPTHA